jgi:hypothetical protein
MASGFQEGHLRHRRDVGVRSDLKNVANASDASDASDDAYVDDVNMVL